MLFRDQAHDDAALFDGFLCVFDLEDATLRGECDLTKVGVCISTMQISEHSTNGAERRGLSLSTYGI